jgi:hypothetical protein
MDKDNKNTEANNTDKKLHISDVRERAINWFNSLDKDFRNKLIKEKRPARAGYVDKDMINLTNNEIVELYSKHVV